MRLKNLGGHLLGGLIAVSMIGAYVPAAYCEDAPKQDDQKKPAKEPVDYKKIKAIFPDTLGGLKKVSSEGQKMKMSEEVTMVTAEARYQKDKDTSEPAHHIAVIDYTNADMASAAAIWSKMEIDKDSDDAYEKTDKIDGNPAYIKYNKKDKNADVTIFVAGEFLVTFTAQGVTDEELHKLFTELPLKKLAELKPG